MVLCCRYKFSGVVVFGNVQVGLGRVRVWRFVLYMFRFTAFRRMVGGRDDLRPPPLVVVVLVDLDGGAVFRRDGKFGRVRIKAQVPAVKQRKLHPGKQQVDVVFHESTFVEQIALVLVTAEKEQISDCMLGMYVCGCMCVGACVCACVQVYSRCDVRAGNAVRHVVFPFIVVFVARHGGDIVLGLGGWRRW